MPSTMTFLLVLFCQSYLASANFQVHPKFAERHDCVPYFCDYFTGLPRIDWIPSNPTVLYQMMQDSRYPLKVIVTIEDIPMKEKLRMKFKYRCSPSVTEDVQEMQHPFQFKSGYPICIGAMPLSIKTEFSDWISDTTYQLKLVVSFTHASKVSFNDALTHNLRIQLEFLGAHWRLESNGLFLRNWDPLLRHNSQPEAGKYYARYYLTKDAIELMRFMNFTESSQFITKEFIAPEVSNLIRNAPEFVKSTIAIGALLLINEIRCDTSMYRSIAFMSKHYVRHYYHESMKLLHIDSDSGNILFSNHGLKTLASRTVTETRSLSGTCDNGRGTCSLDKICAWLELATSSNSASYVGREDILRVSRPDNPYKNSMTAQTSVPNVMCHSSGKVGTSNRVSIFARAAFTNLKCPIVCNSIGAKYVFYRGDTILEPLLDNSWRVWSEFGAVSLHKSGAVLKFSDLATHEDSGEYKCTAHGVEYKFIVEIVTLPLFSVTGTAFVGGELPPRIYARKGDDYAVNCTVFYSNMKSVTITPEFYVVVNKQNQVWSKLSGGEFNERLKLFDSKAKITVSSTSFSKTITLTVSNVPQPTAAFDFSHRFVCNAAASTDDVRRYGVSEYNVQSASDVIIVLPPTPDDIDATISPCCAEGCLGNKCTVMYSLKPDVINRIKSIGLDARGRFKIAGRNLGTEEMKSVTYNANSASLQHETDKGFLEMTYIERQSFVQLVPVFEYFVPSGSGSIISTKTSLPSPNGTSQSGAVLCDKDPSCYYSTESDKSLMKSLTVGIKICTGLRIHSWCESFNGEIWQAV